MFQFHTGTIITEQEKIFVVYEFQFTLPIITHSAKFDTKVSIPHWYDYNEPLHRRATKHSGVSIPHWYDYNYKPLAALV